jgi:hypothetical protein
MVKGNPMYFQRSSLAGLRQDLNFPCRSPESTYCFETVQIFSECAKEVPTEFDSYNNCKSRIKSLLHGNS